MKLLTALDCKSKRPLVRWTAPSLQRKTWKKWKTGDVHWDLVSIAGWCSPVLTVDPSRQIHTATAPSSRQLAPPTIILQQCMTAEMTRRMHCMCCAEIWTLWGQGKFHRDCWGQAGHETAFDSSVTQRKTGDTHYEPWKGRVWKRISPFHLSLFFVDQPAASSSSNLSKDSSSTPGPTWCCHPGAWPAPLAGISLTGCTQQIRAVTGRRCTGSHCTVSQNVPKLAAQLWFSC